MRSRNERTPISAIHALTQTAMTPSNDEAITHRLPVANNRLMLIFFGREMCRLHTVRIGSTRIAKSERMLNSGVITSEAFWLKQLASVINLFQIASRG
jgi:hypothetical protein